MWTQSECEQDQDNGRMLEQGINKGKGERKRERKKAKM
jgi:hypothetical protein